MGSCMDRAEFGKRSLAVAKRPGACAAVHTDCAVSHLPDSCEDQPPRLIVHVFCGRPAANSIDPQRFVRLARIMRRCGGYQDGQPATDAGKTNVEGEQMSVKQQQIDDAADHELCARVRQFLALQHFPSLRKLDLTACGDTIVLYGSVPSFHERQLAVAFCRRVTGVHHVVDQLVVSESAAVERATDSSPRDRPDRRMIETRRLIGHSSTGPTRHRGFPQT